MNAPLKFALGRANKLRQYLGLPTLDLGRMRNDLSPRQNTALLSGRPLDLVNDVNSGTHANGILTKLTDAAIARYLLVQKGASLAYSVAVFTSGTPFGITLDSTPDAASQVAIRLLAGGVGTVMAKSDGSAAIAIGDLLIGVSGGTVKAGASTTGNYLTVGVALEIVGNGATGTDAEFEIMPVFNHRTVP